MALSRGDKDALLKKMRANKAKKGGNFRDPTEWRPKFEKEKELTYRICILPPLQEDDTCLGKDNAPMKCAESWDLYYYQRGGHFINNKFHECPRVRLDGGDCPMCSVGFDLMRESDDKEVRKAIAKEWLSQESHLVNIYFFDHKDNPDDLRGKVMWWRLPRAIFRQCEEALERDDDGGDEDDPKPFGLFFDPEEAFPIKISLREKAGYNNYDDSKMLGKAKPIADSEEEIEDILNRRIDVTVRFPEPDLKELNKIVDQKMSGVATEGANSGFDDDETGSVKESKADKSKAEEKAEKADSKSEDDEKAAKKKAEIEKARKAKEKADKSRRNEDEEDDKPESKSEPASDDDDDDEGEMDDEMKKLLAQLE